MMANIITGFRVLISIALLFCSVFSPVFYILYLTGGLSDMIDGTIARKMNTVTEFGARFDTAADFVFVVVCLIKLLPVISMPAWLCIWIVIIALIKIINIISGYIVQRKLVAVHSVMNKVTGLLLFILPLTFPIVPLKYLAIPVCAVATFAAVQEGHYIRTKELLKNPSITQKELAGIIDKSERTIKTRTVEMQEKGLICRENGKRNGRWGC